MMGVVGAVVEPREWRRGVGNNGWSAGRGMRLRPYESGEGDTDSYERKCSGRNEISRHQKVYRERCIFCYSLYINLEG